jgi:hypothetical protein
MVNESVEREDGEKGKKGKGVKITRKKKLLRISLNRRCSETASCPAGKTKTSVAAHRETQELKRQKTRHQVILHKNYLLCIISRIFRSHLRYFTARYSSSLASICTKKMLNFCVRTRV